MAIRMNSPQRHETCNKNLKRKRMLNSFSRIFCGEMRKENSWKGRYTKKEIKEAARKMNRLAELRMGIEKKIERNMENVSRFLGVSFLSPF